MVCAKCGANLPDNSLFCTSCGTKVEAIPSAPTPNPSPVQPQSTYTPPPVQPPVQPQSTYTPPQTPPPVYQQPYVAPYTPPVDNSPMSVGDFMVTMLVAAIPLVGFILLLVWAFSSGVNTNKKNYCRAVLIWWLIGVGIGILVGILVAIGAASCSSALGNLYY